MTSLVQLPPSLGTSLPLLLIISPQYASPSSLPHSACPLMPPDPQSRISGRSRNHNAGIWVLSDDSEAFETCQAHITAGDSTWRGGLSAIEVVQWFHDLGRKAVQQGLASRFRSIEGVCITTSSTSGRKLVSMHGSANLYLARQLTQPSRLSSALCTTFEKSSQSRSLVINVIFLFTGTDPVYVHERTSCKYRSRPPVVMPGPRFIRHARVLSTGLRTAQNSTIRHRKDSKIPQNAFPQKP